jgi:hypothetical protein
LDKRRWCYFPGFISMGEQSFSRSQSGELAMSERRNINCCKIRHTDGTVLGIVKHSSLSKA